jgi:DNA replicative helicase MCM subunit Mcm2 (Cdc46/Mcm family)
MVTIAFIKNFVNFLIRNLYIIKKTNEFKIKKKNFTKIYKYKDQINAIVNKQKNNFEFSLDDLLLFCPKILIKIIVTNTKRFVDILKEIIDTIILETFPSVIYENKTHLETRLLFIKKYNKTIEILHKKKISNMDYPVYQIIIIPFRVQKIISLTSLKAQSMGKYILIEGLVIEVNKAEYLLKKAVYICKSCQSQTIQSVEAFYFKPFKNCPSKKCNLKKNANNFYLCLKLSFFEKIQKIKIKSNPMQYINYDYFQNLTIRLTGCLTETCKIGDIIKTAGIILPKNYFNNKSITNEEIFLNSYFLDKSFDRYFGFNQKNIIEKEISNIFIHSEIYEKISNYLDIFIIGQNDFKKALLLSLVGANNLNFKFGNILNIFIIIENETISSNIFKLISILASKHFYNNPLFIFSNYLSNNNNFGKIPLNDNDKFTIKISENGVTCIDNIDILNKKALDSILKITNRDESDFFYKNTHNDSQYITTVIAATRMNNYEKKINEQKWDPLVFMNFDLIFSLSTFLNSNFDMNLAKYIINQYKICENVKNQEIFLNLKIIKNLILEAQKGWPFISDDALSYITYCYISIKTKIKESKKNYLNFVTVKSAIKISKCLARIKFQDRVHIIDAKEAFRLLKSKKRILYNEKKLNIKKKERIIQNRIFKIIKKEFIKFKTKVINIDNIEKKILSEGFTCENLVKCISFYEENNLFKVDTFQGRLSFID